MNGEDVPRYLLTGKITCGECGSAMVGSMSSHNHYYYRCNRQTLQGSAGCAAPLAGVVKVENTVIKAIKDHLADTESLRGAFDEFMRSQTIDKPDPAEELGNLKAAMKRKDQERERLVDAVASGVLTKKDIANHMSKLDLESSKLQARIDELNFHKFPAKLTPDDFEDFAKTIQIAANLETKESRRILIDTFVDHVTVYPDHLHIVLNVAITSKNNDVCIGLAERALSQAYTQFNFIVNVEMNSNQGR